MQKTSDKAAKPMNSPQIDKDALLPCPFCGGNVSYIASIAKSFNPNKIAHEYTHRCKMKFVSEQFGEWNDNWEEERRSWISEWNTRATPTQPDIDAILRPIKNKDFDGMTAEYYLTSEIWHVALGLHEGDFDKVHQLLENHAKECHQQGLEEAAHYLENIFDQPTFAAEIRALKEK